MAVVLVGTLDTKGRELGFVRDLIREAGLETIVIDAGVLGPPLLEADIGRDVVFRRGGETVESLKARDDRGEAVAAAAKGVELIVRQLNDEAKLDGLLGLGGSAGTVIGTTAMRALPFGIPKVMVSTLASGQTRPYVGGSDIMMLYPVVDIAGLNRFTKTAISNAANAMIGMVQGRRSTREPASDRPVIAATMFGVTTPCVDRAREVLEAAGCEVLVFHATGVGGRSMEGLIRDGLIDGVLDLTTTEIADEVVGGILSAGPDRLEAAVRQGIPQVLSVGALDMVNFGPRSSVPERFLGRKFHVHNETVTLMRTTPDENVAIGTKICGTLQSSRVPITILKPSGGISSLDAEGRPFFDLVADESLFNALESGLAESPNVRLIRRSEHINDPVFGETAGRLLLESMSLTHKTRRIV